MTDVPLLEERPESARASRPVGAALVCTALFAAIAVPGVPSGLGIVLVATGVAGAVALARPVVLDRVSLLYAGLALLLAATPVLRSAEWVVAVDLVAAVGLGTLAVTRALLWGEILRAPLDVLRKIGTATGFAIVPLVPGRGVLPRLRPVLRGATLGAALVLVFGTLFATADAAFAKLAADLLVPDLDLSLLPARLLVFGVVLLGSGALILAGRRYTMAPAGEGVPVVATRGLARVEWITALTLLDLLFAGFVAVQIAILFGGRDHVLATTGLTYAEYARQGFFQLLAVGALTFGVVAGTVRWARRESQGETRILKVLLGALCMLSLVVLASALRRLLLYENTFGYTSLRISVHAAILWMAGIFVLLLLAGFARHPRRHRMQMGARWLPRASLVLTALALLAFTLLNPEGMVAERNVKRFEATGQLDLDYVRSLGADAAPALAGLPSGVGCWALRPIATGLQTSDPFLGWNLSRARARAVLDGRVGSAARTCDMDALTHLQGVRWKRL